MANTRPLRELARTLVTAAHEADMMPRVSNDLELVNQVLQRESDVLTALDERAVAIETRRNALEQALSDVIHPFVLNALLILQQDDSLSELATFVSAVREDAERIANHHAAVVTSVLPLTSAERTALEKRLQNKLGGTVQLRERTDPSLLGGFVVEAGDWRLDASLSGKIRRLKETLSAPIRS